MIYVVSILGLLSISFAEDIVIRRTEPDPNSQEFPCPYQGVQYECTTLRPVAVQTWMLPSGVGLGFTGASSVGRVFNSSDDQFSATLTSKMEDEDPDSDVLFFTSTLLIIDPVNGSELICSGTPSGGTVFQGNITVILSGIPDPPTDVGYDESVVIVSSVDLEWSRPSYTGSRGVSVVSYTISANGGTVVVSDDSEVVRYTSQSLVYGDVLVSAINSCGQESTPALLNIHASEPPELTQQTVEMDCNTPLNDSRPAKIAWMVGPKEPGVVYPGEERVNVVLDPGNIVCLNEIEKDMSCTATIKEDGDYRVKITRTNEVGEKINDSLTFESSPLIVVEELSQNTLTVTLTVQTICHEVNHTFHVCFGQRKIGSDEDCDFSGGVSLREDGVQPGVPHTFTANESVLSLSSGQQYCYTASLLGDAEDECSTSSDRTNSFPVGVISVIVVVIIVVMIMGCVVAMVGLFLLTRKRCKVSSKPDSSTESEETRPRDHNYKRLGGDGRGGGEQRESEMNGSEGEAKQEDKRDDEEGREPTPPPVPPYNPLPPTSTPSDRPNITMHVNPYVHESTPEDPVPESNQPPFVSRGQNRQSPPTDTTITKNTESQYSTPSQPAPSAGMRQTSVKNASLPTSSEGAPVIPPRPPPPTTNTTVEQEGSKRSKPVIYTPVEISNPRHVQKPLPPPEPHQPALYYATVRKPAP